MLYCDSLEPTQCVPRMTSCLAELGRRQASATRRGARHSILRLILPRGLGWGHALDSAIHLDASRTRLAACLHKLSLSALLVLGHQRGYDLNDLFPLTAWQALHTFKDTNLACSPRTE
jgi:hypothetical protein